MGFTALSVHHGPSIYSHRPVIRYRFEISGHLASDLDSVKERVYALLPRLRERHALCVSKHERESAANASTQIQHLFEHLCIELQNLMDADLGCLRAEHDRADRHDAMIPFDDERVGLEAGTLALEAIESMLSSDGFDWERRLRAFVRFAERVSLPVQDMAVVRAAEARDIPILRIGGRLIQLGHGRNQHRVNGTKTTHTNTFSNDLASNKDYARRMFRAFGLPIPTYERVYRVEDAIAAAKRIGFPVVVKPNEGKMGAGVSVGVKTPREVREAFQRTRRSGRSALVEKYIEGSDCRMLVINGKLEAAAMRVPAHVVGDGVHTIEELVRHANQDSRRGDRHYGSWTRLELDDQADALLAERNYHRNSIAQDGEVVYLKRVANTSAGGTAVDITDRVHPENRAIAERAANAIGLDIAGVDLLVPDITQPMRTQGGVICEINSRPGLRKHLWPARGEPRDVIAPILEMLFPPGSSSRIPIAVVTGVGDTRGVATMLADVLADDGSTVGLAAQHGVFINGKRVDGGEVKGSAATRLLLLDPTVERAVIQLPLRDAWLHGLGFDWANVCAVINDKPIESPNLIEALNLVVGSARSHVILSAEDAVAYGLTLHPAARVWRVNADDRASAEHYVTALALSLGRERADIERSLTRLTQSHVQ
jgi:cyanophycin synthetase